MERGNEQLGVYYAVVAQNFLKSVASKSYKKIALLPSSSLNTSQQNTLKLSIKDSVTSDVREIKNDGAVIGGKVERICHGGIPAAYSIQLEGSNTVVSSSNRQHHNQLHYATHHMGNEEDIIITENERECTACGDLMLSSSNHSSSPYSHNCDRRLSLKKEAINENELERASLRDDSGFARVFDRVLSCHREDPSIKLIAERSCEVIYSQEHHSFSKRWHESCRFCLSAGECSNPETISQFSRFPFKHKYKHNMSNCSLSSEKNVRRLNFTSTDTTDIRPIDFKDFQEVSFGNLLIADDATIHQQNEAQIPPRAISLHLPLSSNGVHKNRINDTTLSVDLEDSDSAAVKLEYGVEKRAQDTFGKGSMPDKFCIAPCPQRNFGDSDFTYNPELLYKFEVQNSSQKCTPKSSGYISTLFSHSSEEEEEKRVLNEKFRFHYPHVQITFSKIKSIKKEMLQIAKTCDLDVPTLAYAYVFYEKVVLKGLVNKSDRKLVAGAALLIATKINDHGTMGLSSIIDHIETVFRINRRDMLQLEIPLCVALDFKLHASEAEIVPHCQRIVSAQN